MFLDIAVVDIFLLAQGGDAAAPTTLAKATGTGKDGRILDAAAPPPYNRGCNAITRCRCCSAAISRTKHIIRKFLV